MSNKKKYNFLDYLKEFDSIPNLDRTRWLEELAKKLGATFFYTKNKMYELQRKQSGPVNNKAQRIEAPTTEPHINELSSEEKIIKDKTILREKSKSKEAESKYNILLKENTLLEEKIQFLLNIRQSHEEEPHIIIPKVKDYSVNIATPVILLSDWHFEETVEANTINEINKYNLEIAQKRWFNCIQNSLWLVNNDRNHSDIKNVVVWLGGDMITGFIHEDLVQSNGLSPTQATRFAKKQIISALEFYLQYGKFEKIYVVCNYGNHGRTGVKKMIANGYKNSYEWMMYHDIADYFKEKSNQISFTIPNGSFAYIKLYDYLCRFFHGDTIKYQGGIGGITVPLIKAIHRYDMQMAAAYNFMGHYHSRFMATKNCLVNGSGIGFNAYAQSIGASPDIPVQSYCLIDQKRGLTISAPIFCN